MEDAVYQTHIQTRVVGSKSRGHGGRRHGVLHDEVGAWGAGGMLLLDTGEYRNNGQGQWRLRGQ